MGLFDYYRPAHRLTCPICGAELAEWQGKDGPNALFVWAEGVASPVEQLVPSEVQADADKRAAFRLPRRFAIYSHGCKQHQPVDADCETVDGVWCTTVVRRLGRPR